MTPVIQHPAIVYCEKAFGTPNGKTAHGLVRRTSRYRVLSVVDSRHEGSDAGEVLDGRRRGIPVFGGVMSAVEKHRQSNPGASHMVIGLAPDGGRLDPEAREAVKTAIRAGLNIDAGLHDFLSEDPELSKLGREFKVEIRDIRKPPPRNDLHFFTGKIERVKAFKIAVLGTDSALGKRTTAWILVDALQAHGLSAQMIGTGQTAWLQGVRYGIVLDSIVNDFVAGEIEHAIWDCWTNERPEVMVLEGQGSLMNPAYPGGMELLAAGRPDVVVLQHAPGRRDYDGFPGYPIHPLDRQIDAIQILSGKPVVAITLNPEGLTPGEAGEAAKEIRATTRLPVVDVLVDGAEELVGKLKLEMERRR